MILYVFEIYILKGTCYAHLLFYIFNLVLYWNICLIYSKIK